MDLLAEIADELAQQVFWQVATLLDLEVDLVFFDSTSTYWQRDTADEPLARDGRGEPVSADDPAAVRLGGFRAFGHSKLAPVVIGHPTLAAAVDLNIGGVQINRHAFGQLGHCEHSRHRRQRRIRRANPHLPSPPTAP
jgi:hypothetical protein